MFAAFVRATIAHGRIRSIDIRAAREMPGVLGVFSGADVLAAGLGGIPPTFIFEGRDGAPMFSGGMPVFAQAKVRYVGEPVVMVVADTLA